MANRPLGSLKFKNLPDTYVVPQLDSTLAVQGKAADSKATGDAIAAVEAAIPVIDSTLAVSGKAADAKATGDAISAAQASIPAIDTTLAITGKAADAKAVGDAIAAIDNVLAPEFSSSTAYTKGQFVWHSSVLYRFTADHAAGSWTGSDVAVAVLGNSLNTDVSDLRSAINDIEADIIATPVMPSWFPELPYPVKKTNGKWTFDDIDIMSFAHTYDWKTYYVDSANGSDSNNGTSAATAFKTFKAAMTKYMAGGYPTRIIIADGSVFYYPETYESSFNMRKSLRVESDGEATIVCGYDATTLAFEQTADNIYASTASLSGKNIVAALDMGNATLDDYGLHKPMSKKTSVADVAANVGSFCIDNGVLYVNPYTSVENVVGLTSSNNGFFPVSSNPFDAMSGVSLKNIRLVGNTAFSRAAHDKKAVIIADGCVFENNPTNNNFGADGYDIIYMKNCIAGYSFYDCYNIDKGNMTAEQTAASVCVFANCKGKEAGAYNTNNSHNCNLSTGHTGTNILRCGFVGYNADGPMIADVNACYTVNYDVTVSNNSYDHEAISKGCFEFNSTSASRTTKQKCVNCFGFDKRTSYHSLTTDGDIWVSGGTLLNDAVISGNGAIYPATE